MPIYSLDMQQRFARIAKQRSDEERRSTVVRGVPQLRKVERVVVRENEVKSIALGARPAASMVGHVFRRR